MIKIERGKEIQLSVGLGGYEWEVKKHISELEQLIERIDPSLKEKYQAIRGGGKQAQMAEVLGVLNNLTRGVSKENKALRDFI